MSNGAAYWYWIHFNQAANETTCGMDQRAHIRLYGPEASQTQRANPRWR
jgi:hypothetical protein